MTKLLTELLVDSGEKNVKAHNQENDFKKAVALANKTLSEKSKKSFRYSSKK